MQKNSLSNNLVYTYVWVDSAANVEYFNANKTTLWIFNVDIQFMICLLHNIL